MRFSKIGILLEQTTCQSKRMTRCEVGEEIPYLLWIVHIVFQKAELGRRRIEYLECKLGVVSVAVFRVTDGQHVLQLHLTGACGCLVTFESLQEAILCGRQS